MICSDGGNIYSEADLYRFLPNKMQMSWYCLELYHLFDEFGWAEIFDATNNNVLDIISGFCAPEPTFLYEHCPKLYHREITRDEYNCNLVAPYLGKLPALTVYRMLEEPRANCTECYRTKVMKKRMWDGLCAHCQEDWYETRHDQHWW